MASIKRLLYIFIPIVAILLMSHNTSALSWYATDVRTYYAPGSGAWLTNSELTQYILRPTVVQGNLNFDIPTNTKSVNRFGLNFTTATPSKYIMNVAFRYCPRNPDALSGWTGFSSTANYAIVSQDWIINGSCVSGSVSVFGASQANSVFLGAGGYGSFTAWDVQAGAYANFNTPTFIVLSDDADYSSVLNAIKNNTDDIKTKLDEIAESADAALDREQSETQDAADDSSSAGSSSSSDATAATSSLISVIGGFVNVLTTAQPTNCRINANLNHIDMGQLDLCANPVPSYIQIIGSIILICAAIPLAIVLFNRFIGLFRSFQG